MNIQEKFTAILDNDEKIVWTGKPEFLPFVLSKTFLIIASVLLVVVMSFFDKRSSLPTPTDLTAYGAVITVVCGLLAVWLMIFYKNMFYAITTKRVLLRSGILGTDFRSIDHDKIADTAVDITPIGKFFGVGNIRIDTGRSDRSLISDEKISAIKNPYEVFKLLKTVSVDVKTDWNFPNNLRPTENSGYKTDYSKK